MVRGTAPGSPPPPPGEAARSSLVTLRPVRRACPRGGASSRHRMPAGPSPARPRRSTGSSSRTWRRRSSWPRCSWQQLAGALRSPAAPWPPGPPSPCLRPPAASGSPRARRSSPRRRRFRRPRPWTGQNGGGTTRTQYVVLRKLCVCERVIGRGALAGAPTPGAAGSRVQVTARV